ncbi:Rootletin [Amphibalanus amphitrite]|uniref:Rootletin n=1 Tax=Amphibalanus amphitrite TaxID=1232801 RepID=A0A6A4WM64_AMPAM|nr:Rootletin [Amphibalanus amphitrite]
MDETDRVVQLERRNAELQRELADVQDKLSSSRAERDDIGIKYSALTDRIGRGRRLEEENQAFRRRLETYQESQRQQAQVVAQLQDKVQQYKQRCAQLEDRMADSGRRLAAADQRTQERLQTAADRDHALDLETALVRLEEAENRCLTLSDVNALLREQLDAAQEANEALTGEIQKLTADWQRLRDEMEHKELDWKEEEQTFNEYYNAEHARMLKLWKEIVGFRRDFSDLKLGTERDLSRVRSEMARLARQTADACSTVNVTGSGPEQTPPAAGGAASAPAVRKQVSQMSAAFSNAGVWEKMQDIQKQEATFRVKKREMETKIKDLSNQLDMSRSEVVEKEKMVISLNKMVHTLETSAAELSQKLEASRLVSEENDVLSQAIREVAQLVVDDSERGPETDDKVTVLVKSTSLARTSAESPGVTDGPPGDSDTPPWEVATPGSGSSTPVATRGSVLSGLILPPFGLPSLNAPSWPTPGSEMESGVGAGPGSEPQPLSRPTTARRSRPQLEPEPEKEPEPEPEPEPDPEPDPEPSEAVENPEESEETSPDAEQGMEVAKAPPPKGKGGCCSLS